MNVKEVGKILKDKREEENYSLVDVQELLKKQYDIDMDASNIMRYEKGEVKSLNPKLLRGICKVLKLDYVSLFVELGFLDKNFKDRPEAFKLSEQKVNTISLPVYGKASAGNGYINLEQEIYFLPVMKGNFSKKSFLVEINGNSMYPTLEEGDFALVDPEEIDYYKNKIYVVTYNDESYIKRVIADDKNQIMVLKSDNKDYDDIYIKYEEKENLKIEGRVVQVISNKYL